ncbi:NYN domain-containing protein [Abyssisolibacter fermentans]|uniref:NYN domain-containing protein n=1 Tax=Abyssisolibacter fermentans TaxID=1766203 RepID=UPI000829EC4C|nr:NYN domain-containing protein [Abyssisolibacter fermentans]
MAKKKKVYKEYLFVDGYNIINAWSELRELNKLNLAVGRNKLIEIMAEYQSFTGIKVIIVFDAHLVKGNTGKKETFLDIDIVYTKEHETADSYIEKSVSKLIRNKKVRVATSDWAEQQIILGRGATRISARELEIESKRVKNNISKKKEKLKETNNRDTIEDIIESDIVKKLQKLRQDM